MTDKRGKVQDPEIKFMLLFLLGWGIFFLINLLFIGIGNPLFSGYVIFILSGFFYFSFIFCMIIVACINLSRNKDDKESGINKEKEELLGVENMTKLSDLERKTEILKEEINEKDEKIERLKKQLAKKED